MKTPTERWTGYLEASADHGPPDRPDSIWLGTIQRVIVPNLEEEEGFAAPPRSSILSSLEAGLEPLPEAPRSLGGRSGRVGSFEHYLNLLWVPILQHIDSLSRDEGAKWTPSLGLRCMALSRVLMSSWTWTNGLIFCRRPLANSSTCFQDSSAELPEIL